ncbi:MAG: hypothetical protein AAGA28_15295 [Pseudomonadota bacterium]
MTDQGPTFGSRLRDLALALLNATLMLAVLLVFGAWLLLGRVQDFAADTVGAVADTVGDDLRTRLETQTTRVSGAIDRVAALDGQLAETAERIASGPQAADATDAAVVADLTDLRAEIGALRAALDTAPDAAQDPAIGARLDALETGVDTALTRTRSAVQAADSKTAEEIALLRQDVRALTGTLNGMRDGLAALRQETSGTMRSAVHRLLLDLADQVYRPGASRVQTAPTDTGG